IRIYNLNSIGLEAADAKDLVEDVIKPLATEDALIQFNETQSTLLVKDVAEVHDRILEVLKAMDKTPKQVWIEGEILQVSRDYKFEFGTEWTYSPNLPRAIKDKLVSPLPHVSTGSNSTSTSGTQTTSTRPDDSIFPIVSSGAGGLKVMNLTGNLKMTLDALMSDDKTQILLQPRALVRNREEVAIDLTQENPQGTTFQNTGGYYPQNGTSGGYGGGIYGSSIVNVVTGLTLSLTPSISNRGLIEMDVDFENSTPVPQTIKVAGQENNAVGRNSQHIQTILIIPSGETRVLGGLISRSSGNSHAGIPYLSKVPWIGWLFGKKTENNSERNLLFFLTPTIVEEKPQIDLVDAPVNAAARAISDQPATEEELEPAKINPIPPDLIPFIQSEHPELNLEKDNDTLILPKPADAKTSGAQTSSFGPAPSADQLRLEAINTLLHDNPSPLHSSADSSSLPITGPGATMLTAGKGATGPSGLIGSGGGGKAGVPTAKRGGKGAAVPGAPAGGSGMPGPARGLAKNPPVPPQLQGPQPQQPQPGSPQQPVQPAAPQPNPIPPAQQVPPPAQPPSPANP
ncbi:type II and III secretion system protein, partial [Candidatus Sumerlaeota bacterium]|nr:type II and III secretion system protein [Candidatus Sumerlaeota bacterium]